jgi:hypothetical protein
MKTLFECYTVIYHTALYHQYPHGGHEGVEASAAEDAVEEAWGGVDAGEEPIYAFNTGQVARMNDALKGIEKAHPPGGTSQGYIVFYASLLGRGYSRSDALQEGWFATVAASEHGAIDQINER